MIQEMQMRQGGYMKSTSLDVIGKLPQGLIQLYHLISYHADTLEIPFLVVGATARDIILHHGFNANIERGTRDIDFGIQVQNWEQFAQLKANLLDNGFTGHKSKVHQLITTVDNGEEWEIDIIPFGDLAGNDDAITWPPQHDLKMSVTGFKEAFKNTLDVTISDKPKLAIKVASPAGMLLLKLVSWLERAPSIRRKDAIDIYYLTKHYSKIPEIVESLYENNFMTAQDYDEHKASTMKLASDARDIAEPKTLSFINNQLFYQEDKVDNLVLDMQSTTKNTYEECHSLIEIIQKTISVADKRG